MIVLTDGLHSLAGPSMRSVLMKYTKSPASGAAIGALTTALLQSSSATTVAAVGFVGAGLMSFTAALGIIFGANIGTTITGWLVVLLGFKLKLGTLILPFIFLGSAFKLFSKGRLATFGYSLAGFGLIFVGISLMQQGMTGVDSIITPAQFPPDTWLGRIQLLLLGVLITIITQSSSAGVATVITALFAGAVNFNQAAALVIGMDVGTTITAAMATIGGSIGSRRTGFSHVIYNVITALGALALLTPYSFVLNEYFPNFISTNPEMSLVAFHTLFNGVGVILILPFTHHFARFIKHIIQDSSDSYTQNLDQALLSEPSVALTTALSTTKVQLLDLLAYINELLANNQTEHLNDFANMQVALDETHAFVDLIHLQPNSTQDWKNLLVIIHVLDHMQRLHERLAEESHYATVVNSSKELVDLTKKITNVTGLIIENIEQENWQEAFKISRTTRINLAKQTEPVRHSIMTNIAQGNLTVPQANQSLEAIRWLQRVVNHIARISYHLRSLT